MIDRLRQALVGIGYDPGADELLDVLWLAGLMAGADQDAPRNGAQGGAGQARAGGLGREQQSGLGQRGDTGHGARGTEHGARGEHAAGRGALPGPDTGPGSGPPPAADRAPSPGVEPGAAPGPATGPAPGREPAAPARPASPLGPDPAGPTDSTSGPLSSGVGPALQAAADDAEPGAVRAPSGPSDASQPGAAGAPAVRRDGAPSDGTSTGAGAPPNAPADDLLTGPFTGPVVDRSPRPTGTAAEDAARPTAEPVDPTGVAAPGPARTGPPSAFQTPGPDPFQGGPPTTRAHEGAGGVEPARRALLFPLGSAGGGRTGRGARSGRVPGGRVLPDAQRLARALRPLARYHDDPQHSTADVEATVRLMAETGLFDLVTAAVPERALTAVLLVDQTPSMRVWHPLASEVRAVLRRSGAFRSVRQQRFDPAGFAARSPRAVPAAGGPGVVVLVLTDAVHPAWRDPRTLGALLAQHRRGPLAVLHALPRRLWRGSGLNAQPRLLTAPGPLSPAHRLDVADPLTGAVDPTAAGRAALPVLRLTPAALAPWVALQTRPGSPRHIETVLVSTGRRAKGPCSVPLRWSGAPHPEAPAGAAAPYDPTGTAPYAAAGAAPPSATARAPGALRDAAPVAGGAADPYAPERAGGTGAPADEALTAPFGDLAGAPPGDSHGGSHGGSYGVSYGPPGALPAAGSEPSPEERIARFRSTFSPEAYRLAVRLSAIRPLTTPVMHLVRSAALPEATAAQVAEVQLGGLLTQLTPATTAADRMPEIHALSRRLAPADPAQPIYDFAPGVRELLFSGLGVERSIEVVEAVGRALAPYLGRLPDFPALVADPDGPLRLKDSARAFAMLAAPVCERLGYPIVALPAPAPSPTVREAPAPSPNGPGTEPQGASTDRPGQTAGPAATDATARPDAPARPRAGRPVPPWPPTAPESAVPRRERSEGSTPPEPAAPPASPSATAQAPAPHAPATAPERFDGARETEPDDARGASATSQSPPEPPTTQPVRAGELRCELLGPVRAYRGATGLPTGSPQQRAVLCFLLLHQGQPVTADTLVEAVWGSPADRPPAAQATLRTYLRRLRAVLGTEALRSTDTGSYVLDGARTDLEECRWLEQAADGELRRGDRRRAHTLLGEALSLWDTTPLYGVPGPFAESQRQQLTEWRLRLLERRLGLELDLGNDSDVVPELTRLVAQHPFRESLHLLLMTVLYRTGRTAEALAVYRNCRRLLTEELGVEPNAPLRDLYERIVRDEGSRPPATEWPDPGDGAGARRLSAHLPVPLAYFVGRTEELLGLRRALTAPQPHTAPVAVISGLSGMGKTALAREVAHGLAAAFPDGQLFIDLRGGEPERRSTSHVLEAFLRALGCPASELPDGTEARRLRYHAMLARRRVLVVIDGAHDGAQLAPLLPTAPGCAALVTSRRRLAGDEVVHRVELRELTEPEGLELLRIRVGAARLDQDANGAHRVFQYCGGLPLALHIAGELVRRQLQRYPWPLTRLADRLATPERRLAGLSVGGLSVAAGIEHTYRRLRSDEQRALSLLSALGHADVSTFAASALVGLPPADTEPLLDDLATASLLHRVGRGRYRFNELTLLFAQQMLVTQTFSIARGGPQRPGNLEREWALTRLTDLYLLAGADTVRATDPGDTTSHHLADHVEPAPWTPTGRTGPAADWLRTEATRLLCTVRAGAALPHPPAPLYRRLADLLLVARPLADDASYARPLIEAAEALVRTADGPHDGVAHGRARTALAYAYNRADRFADAEQTAALALRPDGDGAPPDPLVRAHAAHEQAIAVYGGGRARAALPLLLAAETAYEALGDLSGLARVCADRSRVWLALGMPTAALRTARRALREAERGGRQRAVRTGPQPPGPGLAAAHADYAFGCALTAAGGAAVALEPLEQARDRFADVGLHLAAAASRARLAEAHLAVGAVDDALACAERAVRDVERHGGDWRRADALVVLGRVLFQAGQRARAVQCWWQARDGYRAIGSPQVHTVTALLERSAADDGTAGEQDRDR
ncbi:BTAD domain-containing putative transcriptional regulator [Streptomyces sp. 796.1]|uniref:BTAD domain-containing putative transcriptional regulator n=1 Tax=Streptomyces sp. 796.1 TaxID=3163029 RepID=UPI0039C9E16C